MWRRKPQVAGYFYPEDRFILRETIKNCFLSEIGPGRLPEDVEFISNLRVRGLVSPHAGYIYSGPIAAWGYLRASQGIPPDTVIIMGPNHRGIGPEFSIFPEGIWETPLGEVGVDNEVAQFLMEELSFLKPSEQAHRGEHSIEVQIPFLQYIWKDKFSIVPIVTYSYNLENLALLGEAISKIKKREILFIASSDFSHYVNSLIAEKTDKFMIEYILKIEPEIFLREVIRNNISICGAGAITSLLCYLRNKKVKGRLLKYGNSGDVTRDYSEVVAYASISFEENI